jgi:hypothetical protein
MPKKRPTKGPPPEALKWLQAERCKKQRGRKPTPEHYKSIWDTSYIPERYRPAKPQAIANAEQRLGVAFPKLLKTQLLIQNGGYLPDFDETPFEDDDGPPWTNATVDGIEPVGEWRRASDDHWFESVTDVEGLPRLIVIAAHSESQLCLDYRKSGPQKMPGITLIEIGLRPTEVSPITPSAEKFLRALIAARPADEGDE